MLFLEETFKNSNWDNYCETLLYLPATSSVYENIVWYTGYREWPY
jgi:hypothetical protein